jgi:outer membrane receptor protein involved in Fe transport
MIQKQNPGRYVKKCIKKLLMTGCLFLVANAFAQKGVIRGTVLDADFEVPLPGVKVRVSETGQEAETGDTGSFYLEQVEPGAYTLMFSKGGYSRLTKSQVVVSPGQLAEMDAELAGEYEEMDELVVRDIQLGGASEIGLLNLRMESTALMDSVGAELMSRAGASDAAGALKLVPGATVEDGKYPVIRGLPDRYTVTLLNGVRLPTSDPDKRAVQVDQYPAALIESVQVMKSFKPDLQGDATGGQVDIVLRGIPQERTLKFSVGTKYNSNYAGDEFLSYDTSDNNYLGQRDFDPPPDAYTGTIPNIDPTPQINLGSYGVEETDPPFNYNWGVEWGDRWDAQPFEQDMTFGALATFNYEQEAWNEEGTRDKYALDPNAAAYLQNLGLASGPLVPKIADITDLGTLSETELWNYRGSVHEIKWNGAVGLGIEHDLFKINYLHVFTHNTEDAAIRLEDTRGRALYNPQYIESIDGTEVSRNVAPYRRTDVLVYRERDTVSDQIDGQLTLPTPDLNIFELLTFKQPVLDGKLSYSSSSLMEPNKRILQNYWLPGEAIREDDPNYDPYAGIDEDNFLTWFNPSAAWLNAYTLSDGSVVSPPPLNPDFADSYQWMADASGFPLPTHGWLMPDVNPAADGGTTPGLITGVGQGVYHALADGEQLGNFQQIWQEVHEDSDQFAFNYKWDFENWTSKDGYFKAGVFQDHVKRKFFQQTLSNKSIGYSAGLPSFGGDWNDDSSALFAAAGRNIPGIGFVPNSTVYASLGDIGYNGVQEIDAWYYMVDLPVFNFLAVNGGVRHEEFKLQTNLRPDSEQFAQIINEGGAPSLLQPDGAGGYVENADYNRVDDLPAFGVDLTPSETIRFRVDYGETVAKQQFKEVVPVLQREYPGAPAFVGNPDLRASPAENLDFRLDYNPYPGGLISGSVFLKEITDPIEYYQSVDGAGNVYTFVTNFPAATVNGWEIEIRQDIGRFVPFLEGMNIGGNYTSIDGEVDIGSGASRDVMQMPEYLLNLFWTYDLGVKDLKLGLFYTHKGDTLEVNKPEVGIVPAVYALPVGLLNFSLSGKITDSLSFSFKAKNILDPEIQTVYREPGIEDQVRQSYRKGREYSIGLKYQF